MRQLSVLNVKKEATQVEKTATALIEFCRKSKVDEAVRAFKKIVSEVFRDIPVPVRYDISSIFCFAYLSVPLRDALFA